jgi:cellulose synthase/poly-beta-1,6-N-acetylglucosamine synthase-like glycosyltransferase
VTARLLIGNECISANPKLNNVVKGWVAAFHPWIVMADSNVLMPPDYLHRLLATWRPDTALVSSPAIGCTPGNMWAELECAFLNTYQARWQCFGDSIGMGFAQGKTMLFRRELLKSAGGIRALAFEAAEDAAATKLVRKTGLRGGRAHRLRRNLVRRRGRSGLRCRLASVLAIAVGVAVARSSAPGALVGKLARERLRVARHSHARPKPQLGGVARHQCVRDYARRPVEAWW